MSPRLRARLESALNPGERLVWCDRPRELPVVDPLVRGLGFDRHAVGLAASGLVATALVLSWLVATSALSSTLRLLVPVLAVCAISLLARARASRAYGVTSQGRGLLLERATVTTFVMPPLRSIVATVAKGGAVGDLDLGELVVQPGGTRRHVAFSGISYPGAALDAFASVVPGEGGGSR